MAYITEVERPVAIVAPSNGWILRALSLGTHQVLTGTPGEISNHDAPATESEREGEQRAFA